MVCSYSVTFMFKSSHIFLIVGVAPVGTITAWIMNVKDGDGGTIADLPDGWVRCDGTLIPFGSGSIWDGKRTPDLNGERRFLRGGPDGDMLKLEEDQLQDHKHKITDPGHKHPYVDKWPGKVNMSE